MRFYSADTFGPEMSIGYLVRRVHQLGQDRLAPLFEAEGLTGTHWSALVAVWHGRTTCADVARELAYDKGATTRLMDTLEAKGWLERDRDLCDRRMVNLRLTPEGERVALRCRDHVIECWNGWLDDWQPGEVETLITLLGRLRDTLAKEEVACA